MAARSDVTAKTIGYCEQIGLLPLSRRGANGYRAFDPAVVERLRPVTGMQRLGLRLGEIRAILAVEGDAVPRGHVHSLRLDLPARLDQRIADAVAVQAALAAIGGGAGRSVAAP